MTDLQSLAGELEACARSVEKRRHGNALRETARLLRALDRRGFGAAELVMFTDGIELALHDRDWGSVDALRRALLKHLQKEYGLVLPQHYQNEWMALGMAAFGIPLGAALGTALRNPAFIGVGLPLGLAIGMGIGARKDQEARSAGKVLEVDDGTES